MVSNDAFDGKATHLDCFYLHTNFEQKYPKPAIVLADQMNHTLLNLFSTQIKVSKIKNKKRMKFASFFGAAYATRKHKNIQVRDHFIKKRRIKLKIKIFTKVTLYILVLGVNDLMPSLTRMCNIVYFCTYVLCTSKIVKHTGHMSHISTSKFWFDIRMYV